MHANALALDVVAFDLVADLRTATILGSFRSGLHPRAAGTCTRGTEMKARRRRHAFGRERERDGARCVSVSVSVSVSVCRCSERVAGAFQRRTRTARRSPCGARASRHRLLRGGRALHRLDAHRGAPFVPQALRAHRGEARRRHQLL
eukprot:6173985-Pleurochrysis_carterae.AAC.1